MGFIYLLHQNYVILWIILSIFPLFISPAIEVGRMIPAFGIENVPYNGVPMFNTILLVVSSLSVTLAHKSIDNNNFRGLLDGLLITILLGLTFLILQLNEYKTCMFNISDGAYPSIFYMLTGLHGTHVFIGLI